MIGVQVPGRHRRHERMLFDDVCKYLPMQNPSEPRTRKTENCKKKKSLSHLQYVAFPPFCFNSFSDCSTVDSCACSYCVR